MLAERDGSLHSLDDTIVQRLSAGKERERTGQGAAADRKGLQKYVAPAASLLVSEWAIWLDLQRAGPFLSIAVVLAGTRPGPLVAVE